MRRSCFSILLSIISFSLALPYDNHHAHGKLQKTSDHSSVHHFTNADVSVPYYDVVSGGNVRTVIIDEIDWIVIESTVYVTVAAESTSSPTMSRSQTGIEATTLSESSRTVRTRLSKATISPSGPTLKSSTSSRLPSVTHAVTSAESAKPYSGSSQSAVTTIVTSSSKEVVSKTTTTTSTAPTTTATRSAATSSTASPSASSPPKATVPGTKRGLGIGGSDQDNYVTAFNGFDSIKWVGNWYSGPPGSLNANIEFVPQMYGKDSNTDGTWTKNAETAESKGAKHFLSFGEPETTNAQLYMDAQDAANFWMQEMQKYALAGISVGAPGVLQNTQDFEYLSQFMDACNQLSCDVGFIAVHWFYTADLGNVQGFKDVVNNATTIANGRPVWVDNFQATGTMEAQQSFLQEIVPWLEQNTAVQRYAYVPVDKSTGTGFLNSDASISSLGQFYASL